MIKGMHHTAIATSDLARLVRFYRDVVGFTVIVEGGWQQGNREYDEMLALPDTSCRMAMLKLGNSLLEMFEFITPAGATKDPDYPVSDNGFTHIGLNVVDIDAEYERLSAGGMRFHRSPIDIGPPGILRAAYGRDPDGNVIELVEVIDRNHPFYLA